MTDSTSTDRRQAADRRTQDDRRRGADERLVILEVEESLLRLAVVLQKPGDEMPVLLTRSVSWRVEACSLHTQAGAAELAAAIKRLSQEERLSGCEASLLLGASLCVTRTATGGTASIDRQVKELEERGQFYLRLGAGQVEMASRKYPLDARHEHALVSVATQRSINVVAEAAQDAGLNLRRIESSLVSLCRTHSVLHPEDEAPVLLVSLNEEHVVLGVAQQGKLLLEYMPGGSAKPADTPLIVEKHLKRVQRFCARKHIGESQDITQLYLCGPAADTHTAAAAFKGKMPLNVQPLDIDRCAALWETRGETIEPGLASTLGVAAARLQTDRMIEGPNLIEKWIRESRKHLRPILMWSAAPIAAVLLIALSLLGLNGSVALSNSRLTKQVAQGEPVKARQSMLRVELLAADAKLRSLNQLDLGLPQTNLPKVVERVGHCLPNDVWLERLTLSDSRDSQINGAGFTEGGVYEFVSNLEQFPGAKDVALQETGLRQGARGPVTSFSLTAGFDKQERTPEKKGASNE